MQPPRSSSRTGVRALDHLNLDVHAGECVALMGKNGAGKSTTVRLLSGVETPTSGEILIDGTAATLRSPAAARAAGIVTMHQELTIVPGLSVAENVMLGRWPRNRAGAIDRKALIREARRALDLLGESFNLDAPAGSLSIARQQLIEIARGLTVQPRLFILDEPTSSLTASEVDVLLALVRRLVASGVAVLYVSHRMSEIARVADKVTVVRDGRIIETLPIAEASISRVTEAMVGTEFQTLESQEQRDDVPLDAPTVLELRNVGDDERVHDVSLTVRQGEIVGLAGLLSSGRTETLEMIAGLRRLKHGTITLTGRQLNNLAPKKSLKQGIALVPEDRKADGLVLSLSVTENASMSSMSKYTTAGIIHASRQRRAVEELKKRLRIKVRDVDTEVASLSGGNQQKVVLARGLDAGASVYLLDEPTRGVDIQAKRQICDVIRELVAQGRCAGSARR